jgi:phage terminase large subunit GpA-like protein
VDYQILEGKTSESAVWAKLEAFRSATYPTSSGAELPIARMFVDSGDGTTTNDVYNWVRTQPSTQVFAIKGRDKGILPVSQPSPVDVTVSGHKIKAGLKIRNIDVGFFKSEFYACLKLRPPTEEELAQGWTYPPGYCHFPAGGNYGDEHFKQVCAEHIVDHLNRRTKRVKKEWVQVRPRNEALDCRVYARAAAWDKGLDRMQGKHWEAFEQQMGAAPRRQPIPAAPVPSEGARPGVGLNEIRGQSSYFGDRGRGWFGR